MRLLRLTLTNFKGIKHFTLEPNGDDISIYGDNATGKTTIADAISWLLFGKDSRGNAQFEIKTLGPDGEALHGLEHTVEGVFDYDFKNITLKKAYKEVWTNKRGAAERTWTGHTTDHFVNGVPVREKEYQERIKEIAAEEIFRLLTSPSYFAEQLHWTDRRKALLEICEGVTDQEVIAAHAELAALTAVLADHTPEERMKIVKASMKEISEKLQQIPVRIDEASKRFAGVSPIDQGEQVDIAKKAQAELAAVQERIAVAGTAGELGELKKQLAEAEAAVLDIENKHRQSIAEAAKDKESALQRLSDQMFVLSEQLRKVKADYELKCQERPTDNRKQLQTEIDRFKAEYYEVYAWTYSPENKICQACGQAIPEADNAEEEFNKRRATRLEEIQTEGKKLKAQYDAFEETVKAETKRIADESAVLAEQVAKIEAEIEEAEAQRADMTKAIAAARSRPVNDYPGYLDAVEHVAAIKRSIADARAGKDSAEIERLGREKDRLDGVISRARERIATAKMMKENDERIAALADEEKRMALERGELQKEKDLLEALERKKAAMLEESINKKFQMVRFRLFKDLVNGALDPCCEVTVDGVPYSSGLNNGARINAGLDIIRTLAEHYGVSMPVIVDNAESITQLLPMEGIQVIRLVVSPEHKELTVN